MAKTVDAAPATEVVENAAEELSSRLTAGLEVLDADTDPGPDPTSESADEPAAESDPELDAAEGPDNEADPGEEDEESDPDQIADGEVDGLGADVQEKINRKIAKSTARRKAAEEAAAEAEQKVSDAEAENTRLQGEVESSESRQLATNLGVHPDYVSPAELDVLTKESNLDEQRKFLYAHIFDTDSYVDPDGKEYTVEYIRDRYDIVSRNHSRVEAEAESIRTRATQGAEDDRLAGRKLSAKPGRAKSKSASPRAAPKVPAKVHADASPPISAKPNATAEFSQQKIHDANNSDDEGAVKRALTEQLANVI